MKAKILVLCTGNTCRSQMAEYFLKSFDSELKVFSAGSNPERHVNLRTIKVMDELGIKMNEAHPKSVDLFLIDEFDYVVTVCDNTRKHCPIFLGVVRNRLHIGFEDPANAIGTEEEVISKYREVRDKIKSEFLAFYEHIKLNSHD